MQLLESQMTLDNDVSGILSINEKYDRLSKFIIYTPKKFMTSVVRKTYIPLFYKECLQSYNYTPNTRKPKVRMTQKY